MNDNMLWLARHPRFPANPLGLVRRVMRSARTKGNMDEVQFAALLQAALPHRTISAAMVRAWEEKPPPPTGDVVMVAMGLLGLDLAVQLEESAAAAPSDGVPIAGDLGGNDAARLLDVLALAGVEPDRLRAAARGETRLDRRLVDDLVALTREYWCLYHTIAPRTLLPTTSGHLDLLRRLLDAAPPHLRRELGSVAGETAMLDGWLAFLLDDRRTARSRWSYANDLAHEIGDGCLHAHVLIARSSLASSLPHGGQGGESRLAVTLLEEAETAAGADGQQQTWLLARRAEEHAATHHLVGRKRAQLACERDLAAAETRLPENDAEVRCLPGPRTALDLAGFRGNCALLLGRDREAAEVLARAADDATPDRATLRAVLLNDLGAALARLAEVDAACAAFMKSLDLADETGAAVHAQRVAGAARYLDLWRSSPAVGALEERLRQMA
jgi:hypothetical protein